MVILVNIAVSLAVYLTIALVLVAVNGKPSVADTDTADLAFDELGFDYGTLPPLETFPCRDGEDLHVRHYRASGRGSSASETILVLVHGSGWHSRYFLPLASFVAREGLADVYTPDLRGHGESPERRGDIDKSGRLVTDLADLLQWIGARHPRARIVLGGHSSGGGLVIRFGGSSYRDAVDSYLLLSPYLKYNAPTVRKTVGGWAQPHMPRIVGLSMLGNIGIHALDGLDAISFNMPEAYRDGSETLVYSHRLNTGYAPRNYKKDLRKMTGSVLVAVGVSDESFVADAFPSVFGEYLPDARVVLLDGVTHMGVVVGEEVRPLIAEFLSERSP